LQAQTAPTKTWDKTFGSIGFDYLNSIQQTSDGGFIFGGYTSAGISGDKTQASKGFTDFWIIKTDVNGNKLWDRTYGGNSTEELEVIVQTLDGGYMLGGYSKSGISGD